MTDHADFALLLPNTSAAASAPLPPVVVLMGWVGAQRDGPLLKYAELLAAQGYPSVRSVQPMSVAFSPLEHARRGWALALLGFLEAQGLWPHRQLVLYAFSNGGAFVVEQLLLLAERDPRYAALPARVSGFIFDSAPAYMLPGMLEGVIRATEPPSLSRWLKLRYYGLSTALQPALAGGTPRHATFWANMARLDWGRPLLFLYSADDELCSGTHLDGLVGEKRERGQRVTARRWERSEHVAHFKHHRQEYTALLLEFLAGVSSAQRQEPPGRGEQAAVAAQGAGAGALAKPEAAGQPRARL